MLKTKQEILDILKGMKHYLVSQFKIKNLWLFGSFTRGEQNPSSDVDILVDFDEHADLFNLVNLGSFLEEKLGYKVDIISKRMLREEIKNNVFNEMVPV